ncbi:hypothetical protein ACSTKE_00035, partial [Vibrio parahaemolyticus]
NPVVGFPYTKLMTANVYVDQAAAILICSEAKADCFAKWRSGQFDGAFRLSAGRRSQLHYLNGQ